MLEGLIKDINFVKGSKFEKKGRNLLVSRDYELYLMGLELDYSYDDFESMFKFNNPKAKSTCGCGTSFSIGV